MTAVDWARAAGIEGLPVRRDFFEDAPERVAPRLLGMVLAHRTAEGVVAGRIVEVEAYLGPHNQPPDPAAHAYRGPTPRNQVLFGLAGHAYVYAIYGRYFCMNISCEPEGRAGCVLLRALEPLVGLEEMARRRGLALPPIPAKGAEMDGAPGTRLSQVTESRPGAPEICETFWRERFLRSHPLRDEACAMDGAPGGHSEGRLKKAGWTARDLTAGPSRLCQALGVTRAGENGLDLRDADSPLRVLDDGWRPEEIAVTARIGIKEAVDWPLRFAVAGNACVSGPKRLR
ncbi:MAG: DNA-3-methyladenine glycosylase [Terracidiphilus sp.]|nr:DNA-3-methyladenine glycosylase [Terracidiphilus sp.]